MTATLQINAQVDWIQQIRLIQAIAESDFGVSLRASEEMKFQVLKEKFGLQFSEHRPADIDITDQISLSHSQPLTSVGRLSQALVFPHAITSYCRTLWPERRSSRYSFQGLLTGQRKLLIQEWIKNNFPGNKVRLRDPESFLSRLRKNWRTRLGLDTTENWRVGELVVSSSDRGRIFPIKAWDEQYFKTLADSQFVLCPSGGWIWSYRFFESILCGAIPIAEKECEAYQGFRFHFFTDNAKQLKWSSDDAEHNYRLCVERLTVPKSTLNDELARIVAAKTG